MKALSMEGILYVNGAMITCTYFTCIYLCFIDAGVSIFLDGKLLFPSPQPVNEKHRITYRDMYPLGKLPRDTDLDRANLNPTFFPTSSAGFLFALLPAASSSVHVRKHRQ